MTKSEFLKKINIFYKENNLTTSDKKEFGLFPVYIHLNGFSHTIGLTNYKIKKNERANYYNTVNVSNYVETYGANYNIQKKFAEYLLKDIPNYIYQNNAKEIIF